MAGERHGHGMLCVNRSLYRRDSAPRASLLRAGCTTGSEDGVWMGEVAVCTSLPLAGLLYWISAERFSVETAAANGSCLLRRFSIAGERTKSNYTVPFRQFIAFLSYFAIICTEEYEMCVGKLECVLVMLI